MTKKIPTAVAGILLGIACLAQDTTGALKATDTMPVMPAERPAYKIKAAVEVPLVVALGGFTVYNFSRISKKTSSDPLYVQTLSKANVNWFDRWGVHAYDKGMDNASYAPFFAAMPSPLLLFVADGKSRGLPAGSARRPVKA